MFGLFTPRCPLETGEKAWVERRMRWLADQLGHDRVREARVVLPTDEFFPDPYHFDEASVRRCLDRVCFYMRVDPLSLALAVLPDEAMPGAAGVYQAAARSSSQVQRSRSNIFIAVSQLANPASLIATLAHEVGHEILLGGGLLTEDIHDHEPVTDLLTVLLGLGIFNANSTLHESSWRSGATSGWSIGRQGYLNSEMFGYALGVFAYVRSEQKPAWSGYLRPDAKGAMRKGLRYLQKTGDSLFRPDTPSGPQTTPTVTEIAQGLANRSPTFRLSALQDLRLAAINDPKLVPAVSRCLDDSDRGVRAEAAQSLVGFGDAALVAVPRLVEILQTGEDVWEWTLPTLVELRVDSAIVVPEIARLFPRKPFSAGLLARALLSYKAEAEPAVPALLDALGRDGGTGNEFFQVLAVVRSLVPDAEARIREHFATDPELQKLVLWQLKQLNAEGTPST